jgi:predicted nucleotidyltransferase
MTTATDPRIAESLRRDQVLSMLRDFKRDHAEELGILEIGIFGSVARDAAGANSDLDICVKTKTPNPYNLVHIKDAIQGRFHRKVDIVRVRERMSPLLKERIDREAIYV